MTTRDRLVLMGFATVAVLVAVWLLAVAPEREKASKLAAEVTSAQAQLTSAEGQLSSARGAQAQYTQAYASIVSLGKAVPASEEVPSLIYQLEQASNRKKVAFNSITSSASGASASAGAVSAPSTGFRQMPFTFVFNGSYFDLEHLFSQLTSFATLTSSGAPQVSGRLLTIQSVALSPSTEKSSGGSEQMTGTITATAYVLPTAQGLTGGASTAGPAGTSTQTASTSKASSSPNTPAVVEVNP
jgi:Tfp pilus assembly protein PilO